MSELTSQEIALIVAIAAGAGLVISFPISFMLNYFVALRSRPKRRAAWNAGISYLVATIIIAISIPQEYLGYAPLVAAPAGLVLFLFRHHDYSKTWIEEPENAPDGTQFAEEDWQSGLVKLAALIFTGIGILLYRMFIRQV